MTNTESLLKVKEALEVAPILFAVGLYRDGDEAFKEALVELNKVIDKQ